MLETKSLAQRLNDHLESPEGKLSMENYFNKIEIRNAIERTRAYRVKEHFTDDTSFNTLMQFVLERQNKCDARHYTAYSERSLHIINLIWELASNDGLEIDAIDNLTANFSSMIYDYFGWQFAISHGQGSVLSIYKNRELMYRSN